MAVCLFPLGANCVLVMFVCQCVVVCAFGFLWRVTCLQFLVLLLFVCFLVVVLFSGEGSVVSLFVLFACVVCVCLSLFAVVCCCVLLFVFDCKTNNRKANNTNNGCLLLLV